LLACFSRSARTRKEEERHQHVHRLALERERTDAYNTIAEQRERLSLVSVQRGCPWPAVDYSGIACI